MTIRNNEDRVGARQAPPSPAATLPQTDGGDAFSFVAPTEFVELPSKGRFYPEDHPLHDQETVEIRYMTAKDEDILTSQSLIKKGIVIDRLLQSVLVNKSIRVDDLLVGDKNAIVVAARSTGYANEYKTKITCPACLTSVDYTFDLSEAQITNADNLSESDIEIGDDNIFYFAAPATDVRVGVRLMTGRDERSLLTISEKKKKKNLPESVLTDQLRMMIYSVNGSTKQEHINSFIDIMPASDSRHIRNLYTDIMPNIDLTQSFECSVCSHDEEVMIPFTTEFFWPK